MKAIISLVLSAILFCAAIDAGLSVYSFARLALSATGKVIDTPYGESHPLIRFTPVGGETVSYVQQGLIGGYKRGDIVCVLYKPSNPKHTAVIDSFATRWTVPMLLCFGALITLLTGLTNLSTIGKN